MNFFNFNSLMSIWTVSIGWYTEYREWKQRKPSSISKAVNEWNESSVNLKLLQNSVQLKVKMFLLFVWFCFRWIKGFFCIVVSAFFYLHILQFQLEMRMNIIGFMAFNWAEAMELSRVKPSQIDLTTMSVESRRVDKKNIPCGT